MAKVKADGKAAALASWRAKHFSQLELSLQAAIQIRDDPGTRAKERIEAIKTIGRLLDAMSPEKVVPTKTPSTNGKKENRPTAEEWKVINARLEADKTADSTT